MWSFLQGIRILDLSRLLPGPYATLLLSDLGAEVIKIEEPGAGDLLRLTPPFHEGWSYPFAMLNRNKKSVAINLKTREGRDLFLRMAGRADAILESFRPGVVKRLGIDYSAAREANPKIVYCSLSGYGQSGPRRDRPGHDVNYAGYAGLLSLTGSERPEFPGVPVADLAGGMFAAFSLLAALAGRDKPGAGCYLDLAMTDAVVSWLTIHLAQLYSGGAVPAPAESVLLGAFPCYAIYETADGKHMTVGALEPKFWQNLCDALDRKAYGADQFNREKRAGVFEDLRATFNTKPRHAWLEFFAGRDVPVGPVNSLEEAIADEQLRQRGLIRALTVGSATFQHVAFPARIEGVREKEDRPPPTLGQHTREVLLELGYTAEAVESLRASAVVAF